MDQSSETPAGYYNVKGTEVVGVSTPNYTDVAGWY